MSQVRNLDEYLIREAKLDDIPVLVCQRRLMWIEVAGVKDQGALEAMDAAYQRHMEKALPTGTFKAWLAETKKGEIVAGGGISVYEQPPRPQDSTLRYVYMHSVYTEPSHRSRGLARAIMNIMIQWCRENSFKTLTLHAVDASRSLYESLGFTPTTEMRMFL